MVRHSRRPHDQSLSRPGPRKARPDVPHRNCRPREGRARRHTGRLAERSRARAADAAPHPAPARKISGLNWFVGICGNWNFNPRISNLKFETKSSHKSCFRISQSERKATVSRQRRGGEQPGATSRGTTAYYGLRPERAEGPCAPSGRAGIEVAKPSALPWASIRRRIQRRKTWTFLHHLFIAFLHWIAG